MFYKITHKILFSPEYQKKSFAGNILHPSIDIRYKKSLYVCSYLRNYNAKNNVFANAYMLSFNLKDLLVVQVCEDTSFRTNE